jgi:hypothetical protein
VVEQLKENIMNRIYFILSCCFISLSLGLICLWSNHHEEISVSVTDTANTYTISAIYPQHQTERIKGYLNNCLKPASIFKNSNDLDKEITLADQTRFYIKTSNGVFYLKMDKTINSRKSVRRIKTIAEGISFKGS